MSNLKQLFKYKFLVAKMSYVIKSATNYVNIVTSRTQIN